MKWVKVENNQVTQEGLPEAGYLKDGRSVSGYNLLDSEILIQEGWLPLEDNPPVYNYKTHILIDEGYEISEDKVIKRYSLQIKPTEIVTEPVDEEKAFLSEAVIQLSNEVEKLKQEILNLKGVN